MIKTTECDDQHLIDKNKKQTYTIVNTKSVDFFYKKFIHKVCI